VIQARAAVQESSDPNPLVLVAKVGVSQHETWDTGRAAFLVRDESIADDAGEHAHAHDEDCPFCQAKKKSELESMALIQFTDASGQVLSIDARKLFKLRGNETVVVRGSGTMDAMGNLIVSAEGLHLRDQE